MRSAPLIRARVFAYLYYGLKRFNMHTVVEIIPLLLHASLLLFFAGLVAFLIPVNLTLTVIAAVLLVLVTAVYSVLTLLPLRYTDSPYRTPLSGAFWHILQFLKRLWKCRHAIVDAATTDSSPSQDKSMVEVIFHAATARSAQQSARDQRALVWTMKSLADENELEPFVEAIPDLLWGPKGRRYTYEPYIRHLITHPEIQLYSRIEGLLRSCDIDLLPVDASKRRRIACYMALWATGTLGQPAKYLEDRKQPTEFRLSPLPNPTERSTEDPETHYYVVSTKTMIIWATFLTAKAQLMAELQNLGTFEAGVARGGDPNFTRITSLLDKIFNLWEPFHSSPLEALVLPMQRTIPQLRQMINNFLLETPYRLLFRYLSHAVIPPYHWKSALSPSEPYRWQETRAAIKLEPAVELAHLQMEIEHSLNTIISGALDRLNATPDTGVLHWIDESISVLLSFWRPTSNSPIPDWIDPIPLVCFLHNIINDTTCFSNIPSS
ncbi:hypothetical protein DFH09DRAFT_1355691 [Mycena vulgaris]|nr:hypothetical protein DFH09DRAFT_1355691 [Mycena vulgaris]